MRSRFSFAVTFIAGAAFGLTLLARCGVNTAHAVSSGPVVYAPNCDQKATDGQGHTVFFATAAFDTSGLNSVTVLDCYPNENSFHEVDAGTVTCAAGGSLGPTFSGPGAYEITDKGVMVQCNSESDRVRVTTF